jgi:hypothetical protein
MFIFRGAETLLRKITHPETQLPDDLVLKMTEFYFYYLMRYTTLMQKTQLLPADERLEAWADFHEDTR